MAITYHRIKVKPERRTIKVIGSAKKRIGLDLIERREGGRVHRSAGHRGSEIQPQSATFDEENDVQIELEVVPGIEDPVRKETRTSKRRLLVRSADILEVDERRVDRSRGARAGLGAVPN